VGSAEISLGSATAPVTLVEYASVSCPHCARFAADVFPDLKKRYIDTGKVRYVFQALPIHPREDTAGFLLAQCAGPDRYLKVVDALFRAQPALFNGDLHGWLEAGATAGGLNEAQMRTCISDVSAIQASNARAEHIMVDEKIDSTPTVIINGTAVKAAGPEYTIGDLDAVLRPLLGGKSAPATVRPGRSAVH
jgi:protein-disulfide isomerase